MTYVTKEQRQVQIMEILQDTSIPFPNRTELCELLGIKSRSNLYQMFTLEEIDSLYMEGVAFRREKLKERGAEVDEALLRLAVHGDVAAIKLYYQRHEGWAPTTEVKGDFKMSLVDRMLELEREEAKLIEDDTIDAEVIEE